MLLLLYDNWFHQRILSAAHRQESRSSAGDPKNKKAASRKTGRRRCAVPPGLTAFGRPLLLRCNVRTRRSLLKNETAFNSALAGDAYGTRLPPRLHHAAARCWALSHRVSHSSLYRAYYTRKTGVCKGGVVACGGFSLAFIPDKRAGAPSARLPSALKPVFAPGGSACRPFRQQIHKNCAIRFLQVHNNDGIL